LVARAESFALRHPARLFDKKYHDTVHRDTADR
jgi:hypothetical protein